jgi:NAD(P)-dependent dehydrogenase (short-subunit alcohol dehydrogenase family)
VSDAGVRPEVVVITGIGGMGQAVARRLGTGRPLVLADADEAQLAQVGSALDAEGYSIRTVRTDVSSPGDVSELARVAGDLGELRCVVHTAGVSPVRASADRIVAVDVVGTALVLDAFEAYARPGSVAVCIASMAGTMTDVPAETLHLLATTPTHELHTLEALDPATMESGMAYGIAKRANQARVEAASLAWGRHGGRVVSISPGIIATPMGAEELRGPSGDIMGGMIEASPSRRLGTPADIAAAVEFLVSPAASFITGTDMLVDGGVVAAVRTSGLV